MWTWSLTRPVSRTVRRSTGDLAGAPRLFRVDADTSPCGSKDATPGSRACVHVLVRPGQVGRAGLPGAFWCASPFPLAALSFCFPRPPPGGGCPCLGPLFALPPPFAFFFFFFFSFLRCCFPRAPCVSCFLWFPAPGALGLGAVCCLFCLFGSPCALARRWLLSAGPPPPPLCLAVFVAAARCLVFFFLFLSAPPLSLAFSGFRPRWPWALALCLVRFFSCLLLPGSLCALVLFVPPAWPLAAPPHPPPPLLCLAVFVDAARCLVVVFFFPPPVCAPVVSRCLWFPAPGALGLGAVLRLFCSALRALSPRLGVPPGRWLLRGGCPRPPFCLAVLVAAAPCCIFFSSCMRPRCLSLSLVSGPGCPGPRRCAFSVLWASCFLAPTTPRLCVPPGRWLLPDGCPPPPPLLCLAVFVAATRCSVFFPCVVRPRCLRLSLVSGPGCPGPCCCALFALLACRFSALRALLPLSCFPPGGWLLPGGCCPPPLCLAVFVAAARCCVSCAVLCCVSLGVVLRRAAARCAPGCCAVVFCVVLLRSLGAAACCVVPSGAARRPGALCFAALCFEVFPRAVCSVLCVFCCGVVVRAVVRRSGLCCVCPGVLCCELPVLSALCGVVLRCAGVSALCCSCGA